MKKPDLSKEGMQEFFLLHAEKVVLGVCLVLSGLFLWMGMKKEPFTEKTPSELTSLAQQVDTYIRQPTAWEKLSEFRKGRTNADEIVSSNEVVKGSDYAFGSFRGTPAATAALRTDPEIFPPVKAVADVFTAPLLIQSNKPTPLDRLTMAPGMETANQSGGLGPGLGGLGDGEVGDGSEGGGLAGIGGRGGAGRGRDGGNSSDPTESDLPKLEINNRLSQVNAATLPGVRGPDQGLGADSTKPLLVDVVAVRALVPYQQQAKAFENAFFQCNWLFSKP